MWLWESRIRRGRPKRRGGARPRRNERGNLRSRLIREQLHRHKSILSRSKRRTVRCIRSS